MKRQSLYALTLMGVLSMATPAVSQTFTEVSQQVGIDHLPQATGNMGGGCAWFDYNNDGWEDLYFTGGLGMDKLYHNNGDGTFTDVSLGSGLEFSELVNSMGVVTGDVDRDGDQDIFVITWRSTVSPQFINSQLYINQGGGLFFEVAEDSGIDDAAFSVSGSILDINGDGWLDLYSGNYVSQPGFISENGQTIGFDHECFEDWLYLNNQDGTYSEVSADYGTANEGCTLAIGGTDYDRDGDIDLMVINDFGEWVLPNTLYRNDLPVEEVTDVAAETGSDVGLYGMGVAIGDYDEDLDLDYYLTNIGRNVLLNHDGGAFTDITTEAGVENELSEDLFHTSWGTFFFDFDNDTYLDLFVCNGHIPTVSFVDNHVLDENLLYKNNQDGSFTNIAAEAQINDSLMGRGCAYADYDKDGDLDIAVVNIPNNAAGIANQHVKLYRNDLVSDNHWTMLTLEGVEANPNAIGAQIELHAGGRTFLREVSAGGAPHASQSTYALHFGLGEIAQVDSAVVFWPGGESQVSYPAIDTYNHIVQGEIVESVGEYDLNFNVYPNPSSGIFTLDLPSQMRGNQMRIIDAQGKLVQEFQAGSGITQIELSTPGLYWLTDGHRSKRLVVLPSAAQ